MTNEEYKALVKKKVPKENKVKNLIVAFLTGGLMGIIAEFLTNLYNYLFEITSAQATTYAIVSLIFIGCLLTCLGFFDNMVNYAKAGLIIPITGFAHSMMSATLEYKKDGLVTGIGANMFKLAGTVIVYGVVSAYFFAFLFYVIFGG